MKGTIITTDSTGIVALAYNATGRNRSVYEEKFAKGVDPEGTHICATYFPHNGVEMRTQWLCKMRGTMEPAAVWLDVDFEAFDKWSMDYKAE